MFVVVPLEKRTAETNPIFVATKTIGELGAILHRLELTFRERIVVRYMRPTMRLGHAQRGQQLRHVVRGHRRPAIAVDRQLIFANRLVFNRFSNQTRCQIGALAVGQHPAGHVAAVDVQNHVQVVVGPFLRL